MYATLQNQITIEEYFLSAKLIKTLKYFPNNDFFLHNICFPTPSLMPSMTPFPSHAPSDLCTSHLCTRKEDSLIIFYKTDRSSSRQNRIYIDMQKKWGFKNLKKIENIPSNKVLTYSICLKKNKCNRFRIYDKKGNGLGHSWYKLIFKEVHHEPFNNGKKQFVHFGNCEL